MTFTEVVTRFRKPSSERTVAEMRSVSIYKHPGSAAAAAPVRPAVAEPGRPDRLSGRSHLLAWVDLADQAGDDQAGDLSEQRSSWAR